MHRHNLGEFVKNALLHTGCDPHLIRELDSHATVQIDFRDGPSMYVGTLDEQTVIWSDLCDFHENIVQHRSAFLLHEIMNGFPYSSNRQLALRESEGKLQVYADVAGQYLEDAGSLAEAINGFFESQERLVEILRR